MTQGSDTTSCLEIYQKIEKVTSVKVLNGAEGIIHCKIFA